MFKESSDLTTTIAAMLKKYDYAIHDIAEKNMTIEKIMEKIVNYYEDIIRSMPGNVYWFDKNLTPIGCNQNVLDLLGISTLEEFKKLSFEKMGEIGQWTHEAQASFKEDTQAVLKTGIAKLSVEEPPIPNPDGRALYFLSSRVPLFDRADHVVGVIGISIDITDRKKMEEELIEAKEAAEEASYKKTLFMENMSHDFKTPLNGIYGLAELLKDIENLPSEAKELVELQRKSILRLKKLVLSVLDFDRIHSGQIELQEEELNLLEILESIVHNLAHEVKDKMVNIIIHYSKDIPQHFMGDSYAVTSILLNILSNAVKFTEEGQVDIVVKMFNQEDEKQWMSIEIQDTGIGIPANQLDLIFERFHRLTFSNKGLKSGHGIGLAVVKELVEKIEGKIEVKSEEGKGSSFILTLPLKLQNMERFVSDWQKNYPHIRILLINDKKTASDVILDRLNKKSVTKVQSFDAIRVLQDAAEEKNPYHIVLVDDEIVTINPIELIKILPCIKGIPKLMPLLSCKPQNKEYFDRARVAGYVDFILKPVLPTDLELKINQAWERWSR